MQTEENYTEENLKRLIERSTEPRPDISLRRQVLNEIMSEQQASTTGRDFPAMPLFLLTGMLICILFLINIFSKTTASGPAAAFNIVTALMIIVNILFIPVSGLTIVIRRRKTQ